MSEGLDEPRLRLEGEPDEERREDVTELETEPTRENVRYLATKREKLGHRLHHQDLKFGPLEGE